MGARSFVLPDIYHGETVYRTRLPLTSQSSAAHRQAPGVHIAHKIIQESQRPTHGTELLSLHSNLANTTPRPTPWPLSYAMLPSIPSSRHPCSPFWRWVQTKSASLYCSNCANTCLPTPSARPSVH